MFTSYVQIHILCLVFQQAASETIY